MKLKYAFLFIVLGCLVTGRVLPIGMIHAADDSTAEVPKMVEVEANLVRVTESQMKKAMGEDKRDLEVLTSEHLEKTMANLLEEKADIFGNPRTIVISGQKAAVNSVKELRYPTEFDLSKQPEHLGKYFPTAFDTRNIGISCHFKPIVLNEDGISLALEVEVTKFLGFVDYSTVQKGKTDAHAIEELLKGPLKEGGLWQPIISSFKVETTVFLHSGQTILLGGLAMIPPALPDKGKPSEAKTNQKAVEDPRIYIFVTARVVSLK